MWCWREFPHKRAWPGKASKTSWCGTSAPRRPAKRCTSFPDNFLEPRGAIPGCTRRRPCARARNENPERGELAAHSYSLVFGGTTAMRAYSAVGRRERTASCCEGIDTATQPPKGSWPRRQQHAQNFAGCGRGTGESSSGRFWPERAIAATPDARRSVLVETVDSATRRIEGMERDGKLLPVVDNLD